MFAPFVRFFRGLLRQIKIFLLLCGSGAFLVLISILFLSVYPQQAEAAERLAKTGKIIMIAGYPLYVIFMVFRSFFKFKKPSS